MGLFEQCVSSGATGARLFFLYPFFLIASFPALVASAVGVVVRVSEWLERNLYDLPIIGLAFYYSGFALVDGFASELFLIVVLLSVPLLGGLAVRRRCIVILGAALTCLGSILLNIPFSLLDHFGFGWILAGDYIAFSGFLFMLTMIAWIRSTKDVFKRDASTTGI